ncbi:Uncharacterised protein [Mycobacteroides abscessus subsp. abscessus]|uniref:hypothetical protein n=1 Tax=Mycobacteroides abscessus TaxID=36809 RepID=UPI0009D1FDE0|nr:hypothetical protein [Mycobacteroides abscessus]SKO34137.1 Uncharacterised protein [Mycobacteroides abscessus subsp. abscessus]
MSKRDRKFKPPRRKPARRHVSPGLTPYTPTALPDSLDGVFARLAEMPAPLLPTLGLADVFLGMSPVRTANQCPLACWVLSGSLMQLGIHPETVAASIDVPNARGGTTRYGSQEPRFTGKDTIGHMALIADGKLIDATGCQFPEIAEFFGVRAIGGDLRGHADNVLTRGGVIPLRLDAPGDVMIQYTLGRRGSADGAMTAFLDHQVNQEVELGVLSNNLTVAFTKILTGMPSKLRELARMPQYGRIVAKADRMQHREIAYDEQGVLRAV